MRLHLLGLSYSVTDARFSSCPFTQKVRLFAPMLRAQGYEVVHYGNAPLPFDLDGVQADAHVTILERDEHLRLLGMNTYDECPARPIAETVTPDLLERFSTRLAEELEHRVAPGDVICLMGQSHDRPTQGLRLIRSREAARVEIGVGYPDPFTIYRVYESEAWRHWMMGSESRAGAGWGSPRREWVIPNYYDGDEWPVRLSPEPDLVLFFGRLVEAKGCALIPVLARAHPHLRFVLCGQGDPTPFLGEPNVSYLPPVTGRARAHLLGSAAVMLCPSLFIEPFCGAAVEAMLCGTPVLSSDAGAFTETNIPGVTGYRCSREREWLDGIPRAASLDRATVAASARARFLLPVVAPRYRRVFEDIAETLER